MHRWLCPIILLLFGLLGPAPSLAGATAGRWTEEAGYRRQPVSLSWGTNAGFSRISAETSGIQFTNQLARDRYLTNQIYLNGSGVAAGDIDGDGWCDLYFCGLDSPNRLYRNLGGWRFEDISTASGVSLEGVDATGVAMADLDSDGDLDLVINSVGQGTWLLMNDGKGRFAVTHKLNPNRGGTSMALADIDGDGDLDLYVANYRTRSVRDEPGTRFEMNKQGSLTVISKVNGIPVTDPSLQGRFHVAKDGKIIEDGEPDLLFRNDGKGTFTAASFTDGTFLDVEGKPLAAPLYDWGLSVMFRDLNGDGAPDLYVCNDFESPDRVWLNDGKGIFRAMPKSGIRCTSMFSMGIDVADINRDGLDDVLVVDMQSRTHAHRQLRVPELPLSYAETDAIELRPQYSMNTLFLNRGQTTYSEIAFASGINASDWSWTPVFLDVDLDGYEDLLITTGHEMEMMNMDTIVEAEQRKTQKTMSKLELLHLRKMFHRMNSPNVAFRNRGNATFEDAGTAWGFDLPAVSHGMALADLDNDGDLDIVINNLNDPATLLRNEATTPRLWISLKGSGKNTQGIGAKLRVLGGPVIQSQEVIAGGRYLSADEPARTFSARAAKSLRVEIDWRSGRHTVLSNVAPNQRIEVSEETSPVQTVSPPAAESPWFQDLSSALKHRHQETPYNDLQRQPLLSRKLSQLGPGIAWQDLDGDGWEDLIIGGGRGGAMAAYHNDSGKAFSPLTNAMFQRKLPRDQAGLTGVGSTIFAGASNYEDGQTNGGSIRIYDTLRGAAGDSLLGVEFSTGPLAMADIDRDGDLDLFVGGRCVSGRYPEPATSLLLRNDGGRMSVLHRFEGLGLVSGAIFTDLDGDGSPELVIACDWGPIRVFRQLGTAPEEITATLRLADLTGWWNGVAVGDFDEDGRLDIVASNWGRNHAYAQQGGNGNRLFYGSLMDDGAVQTIEAYYDALQSKVVPYRSLIVLSRSLPFVRERIQTFAQYGTSSVAEILGDRFSLLKELNATTLDSTIFLNRGDHFVASSLPWEAQLAPAFGITVSDLDGDGHEDIFLAQNFFGTNPETPPHAAGLGLWLKGDGRGSFRAVSLAASGIHILGEQRGCAASDFDADGRVDLAVSQNNGPTVLLHNERAKPGLRVRLKGIASNPSGAGAVLQLSSATRKGYVREVHAGGGYWSMDGAVQVMTHPETPTQLTVRWPDGKTASKPIPPGSQQLTVSPEPSEGPR